MVNLANNVMLVIKLVKIVIIIHQMIVLNATSMLLYQHLLLQVLALAMMDSI